MRSLRWLPGALGGEWGGGSEKYKHKYNYKILAWSLILSVMNYMRLFIKIETPGIRSSTVGFFPPTFSHFPIVCDQEPFPPYLGCKVLLTKTLLRCRTQRRITQMPPFLWLPCHTLFTTHCMLQGIN